MVGCAVRTGAGVANAGRIGELAMPAQSWLALNIASLVPHQAVERKATLLVEEALITRKARTSSSLVTATALPAVVVAVARA